jgi:hypothetical protein
MSVVYFVFSVMWAFYAISVIAETEGPRETRIAACAACLVLAFHSLRLALN